jgi:hypothetical protein
MAERFSAIMLQKDLLTEYLKFTPALFVLYRNSRLCIMSFTRISLCNAALP